MATYILAVDKAGYTLCASHLSEHGLLSFSRTKAPAIFENILVITLRNTPAPGGMPPQRLRRKNTFLDRVVNTLNKDFLHGATAIGGSNHCGIEAYKIVGAKYETHNDSQKI